MQNYFAVINKSVSSAPPLGSPDSAEIQISSRIPSYRLAFASDHMRVYTSARIATHAGPHRLDQNRGTIVGTIFKRDESTAITNITASQSAEIINSHGRNLPNCYWGAYVAFVEHDSTVSVIRDPSGAVPCHVYETPFRIFIFSDLTDAVQTGLLSLTIDWNHVAKYIGEALQFAPETGFSNLQNLMPGECLRISQSGFERIFYWHPYDIYRSIQSPTLQECAYNLRHAVLTSVRGWASVYKNILVSLSGGFDSTVALGCLAQADQKNSVICLNFYNQNAESDERIYARDAARHYGFELVEKEEKPDQVHFENALKYRLAATPKTILTELLRDQMEAEAAQANGGEALVSGSGGDAVFGQSSFFGAVDYLQTRRRKPFLIQAILDTAIQRRESIWAILWEAVLAKATGNYDPFSDLRSSYNRGPLVKLFTQEAFSTLNRSLFDDEVRPGDIPPGKWMHIKGLHAPYWTSRLKSLHSSLIHVPPLVSQPVIEAAIRIPTYYLSIAGQSRGLAKAALGDLIPPSIRRRNTKGGINRYLEQLFEQNKTFLQELLIDGLLVQNGIFDRKIVEEAFSPTSTVGPIVREMLICEGLGAEAWARYWLSFPSVNSH